MRPPTPRNLRTLTLEAALLVLLLGLPGSAWAQTPSCSSVPSLGEAASYGLFEVGTGKVDVSPGVTIISPVGVSEGGGLTLKAGATIDGNVYHGAGSNIKLDGTVTGSAVEQDMSRAIADAVAFSEALADLPPTEVYTPTMENDSFTFIGNGGLNVITTPGKIDLKTAAQTITLVGGPDDVFVFNIYQPITMSGGGDKIILQGGVDPDNVIFHIPVASHDVEINDDSSTVGTFLNVSGKVKFNGNGTHTGPFIGGTDIQVAGNLTIGGGTWGGCDDSCPSPEISGLSPKGVNIQTPAAPSGRTAANSNFYFATFDPTTWEGHVEALRLAANGTVIDANGDPAVDPLTSQLVAGHVSYWDAGEELKSDTTRTLLTTKGGLTRLINTANITTADLTIVSGDEPVYPNYPASGVDTLAELHTAIIDHLHGKDAFDEDGDSDKTDLRPFVLGDIFHSNPMLIGNPTTFLRLEQGYAGFLTAYETRDWVLYAGSNDGFLHAFDAGEAWDGVDPLTYDAGTGEEFFGYLPGVLLPKAKITPVNSFRTEFFVDGSLSAADAWLGDIDSSGTKDPGEWATVLIASLREGGAGYLALDVTAPGAGSFDAHGPYPKLLWEFTHAKLGNSWSKPVITRVRLAGPPGSGDKCGKDDGDGDCVERWVAIFGGGYDESSDPNKALYVGDPTDPGWTDRSKAIFMVALDTGQVLASVEFDATGTNGPADMKYAMPGAPAVLDLKGKGFGSVVYIGDLGGQLWKWDISAKGVDSDTNGTIDNWKSGVHFRSAPADMGGGEKHYHSFFGSPSASYVRGVLTLALGTGERLDLTYIGDPTKDDNNRFFVIPDVSPTGVFPFPATLTEASLTNVTSLHTIAVGGLPAYFFKAEEGEKFVTDPIIFAGHVLTTSFKADPPPGCGAGESFFYAFRVANGLGHFTTAVSSPLESRRMSAGSGVASSPRVSIAVDPKDDVVYISTSEGEILTVTPPARDKSTYLLYWQQVP